MPRVVSGERAAAALGATLALLLALVGVRLLYVHSQTWAWTLAPSAVTPKIHFADRNYLLSSRDASSSIPAQAHQVGRTLGGGRIVTVGWPGTYVPTVLWVRDAGDVWTYALSGGP